MASDSLTRPKVLEIAREYGLRINIGGKLANLGDVAKDLAPASPYPKLFGPLLAVANAVSSAAGIKCKGSIESELASSYKAAVVSFLAALSQEEHSVNQIIDTTYGAYFIVALPATVFTVPGTLTVGLFDHDTSVAMRMEYLYKGQMFAWRQGEELLKRLVSNTKLHLGKI